MRLRRPAYGTGRRRAACAGFPVHELRGSLLPERLRVPAAQPDSGVERPAVPRAGAGGTEPPAADGAVSGVYGTRMSRAVREGVQSGKRRSNQPGQRAVPDRDRLCQRLDPSTASPGTYGEARSRNRQRSLRPGCGRPAEPDGTQRDGDREGGPGGRTADLRYSEHEAAQAHRGAPDPPDGRRGCPV